jgi:hypothetical protein
MADQLTTSTKQLVVWGSQVGVQYTTGTIVPADNLAQSASFTKDGDEAEIRDAEGEVQTFVCYNKRETLDIEVIPVGTTAANAGANNVCPTKGEIVTITDLTSGSEGNHSELASTSWICINASQSASNTSEVRISMSLRKYAVALT